MKLLISISYYIPHISGLTNATKNLAELLAQNGYQVTVLATQHDKTLSKNEILNGVRVKRMPYLFKLYKGFIIPGFMIAAYKAILQSEQVIINLPQAEGFIVAGLAKLMRKKVHCIYHCNLVFDQKLRRTKLMKFVFGVADEITLSLADTIVISSDDFAKELSLSNKHAHKIQIIQLVIAKPVIKQQAKDSLNKKLGVKKRYIIGFIGRIAAEKGIEYLLETTALLKKQFGDNFLILLAGPERVIGEQIYLEKITNILEKHQSNIIRLGELKEDELGAFYQLLDVLVLPSINSTEAFGMVQVEAMLCGTPVVATDLPGVRVPIKETGMGEIVSSKDTTALAQGIIKILTDKENYIKKSEQVGSYFSSEKILQQWKKLFS